MDATFCNSRNWPRPLTLWATVIAIWLLSAGPTSAAYVLQATLYVAPSAVAPGGRIYFAGGDFSPSRTYDLVLEMGDEDVTLASAVPNSRGLLTARATLPNLPPGIYVIEARYQGTAAAEVELIVNSPPVLTVTPTTGAPGNLVDFEVGGLIAGQLTLDFDGIAVAGPLAVEAGVYTGSFVVPDSRQSSANAAVTVTATNSVGGAPLGVGRAAFTLQPARPRPRYTFVDVELPQRSIEPGRVFTVTGRIDPPPDGALRTIGRDLVTAVYRAGGGQTIVLDTQAITIDALGQFNMQLFGPSLHNGDGLVDVGGGAIGLLIKPPVEAESRGGTLLVDTTDPAPVRPVTVRVCKAIGNPTGCDPIENALVRVRPIGKAGLEITPGSANPQLGAGLRLFDGYDILYADSATNWHAATAALFGDYNPLALCGTNTFRGFTDATGEFSFNVQRKLLPDHMLSVSTTGNIGVQYFTKQLFFVTVNALGQGYGSCDPQTGDPNLTYFFMLYNWHEDTFYQVDVPTLPNGNLVDGTIATFFQLSMEQINNLPIVGEIGPTPVVTFNVLPLANSCDRIPVTPALNVPFQNFVSITGVSGRKLPLFGNVYSFADPKWAPLLQSAAPLNVSFAYDVDLYGPFTSASLTFNGQPVGVLSPDVNVCGDGTTTFGFTIPNALTAYPAPNGNGVYVGELTVAVIDPNAPGGVYEVIEPFLVRYVAPPDWLFRQQNDNNLFINRTVTAAPWKVTLAADENVPPSQQVTEGIPNGIGDVENRGESRSHISQSLFPNAVGGIEYSNTRDNELFNNDTPAANTHTALGAGSTVVQLPTVNETLIDTGKIPLFRYGWGIWPIASATFGADFWLAADITQSGSLTLHADGAALASMTTAPAVEAGIEVFFDLSILFGLVEAYAAAKPSVTIATPVTLLNGAVQGPPLSGTCFTFLLRIYYEISAGIWPLEVEVSDEFNLIGPLSDGNACSTRDLETLRVALPPAQFSQPPSLHPALATDGMGETALLYMRADGMLTLQYIDALGANPPIELTQRPGLSKPLLAYYQPGQAVGVWAESSLSAGQIISATANLDDEAALRYVLPHQHIAYSQIVLGQAGPVINLTSGRTGGEGDLTLAACMSTTPGCPTGGAVTAVWLRDLAADIGRRQFALFYSTFNGLSGAWSAPQRVDPSSTAEDTQPNVAYVNGIPVVAWVRNPTRSLADLDQRQIAYRFLALGQPVVTPATLPRGIASPSLAADAAGNLRLAFTRAEDVEVFIGNQQTLHTAATTCNGTTCGAWTVQKVLDKFQRDVRGERPQLLIKPNGEALIALRLLGFGAPPPNVNPALIDDPQGVVLGIGVAAVTPAHFANVPHTFDFQSGDGGGSHQLGVLHNPLSDELLLAHVALPIPTIGPQRPTAGAHDPRTRTIDPTQPLLLTTTPAQPNFKLLAIDAPLYPPTDVAFPVTVQIVNEGQAWDANGGAPLDVVATWQRGYRVGVPAGSATLAAVGTQGIVSVTLSITPSVDLLQEQTLLVTVNPRSAIEEYDRSDNVLSVAVGGLPRPARLIVRDRPGRSPVHLGWEAVDDPRVAGYRIYRALVDGRTTQQFVPVGTSLTNGFVDLRAVFDATYTYAVTTYSTEGYESAPSDSVAVQTSAMAPTAVGLQAQAADATAPLPWLLLLLLIGMLGLGGRSGRRRGRQ